MSKTIKDISLARRLRLALTLLVAKTATRGMRILGKKATFLPGVIARKLFPDFLAYIRYPGTVVCVTGTNGKTTVCNLLSDAFESRGIPVLNNTYGSNTVDGIMSAVVQHVNWRGWARADYAILEIDELSSRRIFPYLTPDYLLITNLFRDSYNRNAHADFIASVLEENIADATKLVLNAEDLLSSELKPGNERVYFAIDKNYDSGKSAPSLVCDVRNCPECGHELTQEHLRYHHIGYYFCQNCGFKNRAAKYLLTDIDIESSTLQIDEEGTRFPYHLISKNIIDSYNSLAAISMLRELGWPPEEIAAVWQKQEVVKSRYEERRIGDKPLDIMLAKALNPISASRVFDYVRRQNGKKLVVLFNTYMLKDDLNNENTGWLYDIDCELLNDPDIVQIVIGARRAYDYKVRLELAGVQPERIRVYETLDVPVDDISLEGIDRISIFHDINNMAETNAFIDRLTVAYEESRLGGGAGVGSVEGDGGAGVAAGSVEVGSDASVAVGNVEVGSDASVAVAGVAERNEP